MTALAIVGAAFVISGAIFLHAVLRAPYLPQPSFDEHAATAAALLQPDHPHLPDCTPLADAVQAWLRERTQTTAPEES